MSGKTAGKALRAAISDGILGSPSLVYEPGSPRHAALFYDLDEFEAGLDRAKDAFGKGNLNVAVRFIGYKLVVFKLFSLFVYGSKNKGKLNKQ